MLKLFGLCSGSLQYKIKPGQIGIEVYNADVLNKRDILPLLQSSPEKLYSSDSLKKIITNEEILKPVTSFKHDSTSMTEGTGDQYTFLRTVLKSNFEEISTRLKDRKQQFTDPQFPPNKKSLGDDPRVHKAVQKWIRVTQLYQNPVFFADDVQPYDVIQGYIPGAGNCYFLSALANLARNPSRIKQIFGNTQVSKQGIYYVRLFHNGTFKQIIIDDFVPVSATGAVFARPPKGSGEIWVQLLQKSYAKLFGNYKNMNGGLPSEAYYALTGAPTFYYSLTDSKQLSEKHWKVVLESYQNNYCVDFGSPFDVDISKLLQKNHAYTMLGAYEIQGYRIIKLRNPMGRLEWIGRASDFDIPFWESISPQNKKMIGYQPNKFNDGIFYMIWEDVYTYFVLFEVCQYKTNANVLSIQSNFTIKNANMYQIQTEGGQAVFSLVQDSRRGTETNMKTFKYSKSYFVIAKLMKNLKGQSWYKVLRTTSKNQFAAHHQRLNLEPGTYIAYCKYRWTDQLDKQASFVVYSDITTRIRQVKQSEHPKFLEKAFMSIPNTQVPDFIDPKDTYTYVKRFYGQSGAFGFYAVRVKKQTKQTIEIEIDEDLLKLSHLTLKKPYKNKGKQKILLGAGQSIIVLFRNKDVIIPKNLNVPELNITVRG